MDELQSQQNAVNQNKLIMIIIGAIILSIFIIIAIFSISGDSDNGSSNGSGSSSGNGSSSSGEILENPYGERTGRESPSTSPETGSSTGSSCPHPGMIEDDSGTCVCGGGFEADPTDPGMCVCKNGLQLDPGDSSRCIQSGGGVGGGVITTHINQCPPYHVLNGDKTQCIPVGLSNQTTAESEVPTVYGYQGFAYNGPYDDQVHLGNVNQAPSLLSCMTELHQAHKNVNYGPRWNIGYYGAGDNPDLGCKMYMAPNFVDMQTSCDMGSCGAQYQDSTYIITTEPQKYSNGAFLTPTWVIYPDGTTEQSPNLNA